MRDEVSIMDLAPILILIDETYLLRWASIVFFDLLCNFHRDFWSKIFDMKVRHAD